MRSDRITKFLLGLIAVGLWALTMTQVGMPAAGATEPTSPFTGSPVAADPQPGATPHVPVVEMTPVPPPPGPTSTLPLRWRVAWAALETGSAETWCSTAVVVTNTTAASVTVEVEWMQSAGTAIVLNSKQLSGYQAGVWGLDGINNLPWAVDHMNAIVDFKGYALVTANDPRIMVSAFQYCRTDSSPTTATVLAHTNIPAYPVGATMEYFQAGMPATWTPPMVEPDVPE
jgi:hypothetical protein